MSAATDPEKPSLWLEAFRVFGAHWHEWLKYAVWFFIIIVPLQFIVVQGLTPYYREMIQILKTHPKDFLDQIKDLPQPNHALSYLVLFVYWIQNYFFNIIYLRHAPIIAAPTPSVRNFFYAFGKQLLSYLVMFGWCLLFIIPAAVVGVIALRGHAGIITAILVFGMMVIMFYVMVRYAVVYPLAAEKIPSALKVSAQLVRGNVWRLIGNGIVMFAILLPFSFISVMGYVWAPDYLSTLPGAVSMAVFSALGYVVFGGIFSAYVCAMARILYKERRQADPTFILTTRD